ncbi:hypothetical protein CANMA_000894 [Candida margitis]|uniref:uncharacterized protein n=1 Tax=Candida margitis TaxID=1775924 RepID=UPI002227B705|nr:uncharacterized protein CANMA_000894 [Candida margitis]KAI5970070.1 hypothetical protein CANMA_000894 [Candida margitis]
MDVYQRALKNPDPPKKPTTHSKSNSLESEPKVSFIPGVPSISQLHQESRLQQTLQPLPPLIQPQQHLNTIVPTFPAQQSAFPPQQSQPTSQIQTQFVQPQPSLQVPNQGNMQPPHTISPNNSVTSIYQKRSPVLTTALNQQPEQNQQQQQQSVSSQQHAQLKHDFSSKKKRNSRRKHRNSHLGCGTCKKRRIKCDETLPSCLNCLKGKLHCAYLNLDNHARSALRMAQYNQNMRQERSETDNLTDEQQQQQQQQQINPPLIQQQSQNGPILASVPGAPPPPPPPGVPLMANSGSFITVQQPIGPGLGPGPGASSAMPSTAVMQSPYGPISLVPVLTNTGAVVYAPTSTLAGVEPVSHQSTPTPSVQLSTHAQQPLSQPSIPLPPQQQQRPNSIRGRVPSVLSASSSAGQDTSVKVPASVSPLQQNQRQRLPSLTPITSTAASAATLASQNISIKPKQQQRDDQQHPSNTDIRFPPLPLAPISVPSISVSKSVSSSVSPSIKSDSEFVTTSNTAPVLSPISMANDGTKGGPSATSDKSPILPSISQITGQQSTRSPPGSAGNTPATMNSYREDRDRDRAYTRSEANTASVSRSRSRSPTRSHSRTTSPQSTVPNAANATITTTTSNESNLIPKSGSVSNFGSLSIKEEEISKNGELSKLPKTGVDAAATAADNGLQEEKVSISKLIT